MLSDFNCNFGFVVEQIFELGYTIKSRCFDTYKKFVLWLRCQFKRFVTICATLTRQFWRAEVKKSLAIFTPTSQGIQMEILAEKREEFQAAGSWSILKNCARESHKVDPICAKPKHCKTRVVFPTKVRNTEILLADFTDHFSGYWMYWLFMISWLPVI